MMQVISSIEVSSSYQRLIACLIIASAAFSAELDKQWGMIMLAASSLEMNSQTPSLARIMNWSPSMRFISRISGEAITPTQAAAWSPNDLVMASPGISSLRCQTLKGPNGFPFISLYGYTLPPFLNILASSSGSSALWSLFSGIANIWSCLPVFRTSTALESPTFEQNIFVPTMSTDTHVDPLNLKLILESRKSESQTCMKLLLSYSFTSVESTTLDAIFA